MRRICRALLWVAAQNKPVSTQQVADELDITHKQAQRSLRKLLISQKLERTEDADHVHWWTANDEYEPPSRPAKVKAKSPVTKAVHRRQPVAMQDAFKFAANKIAFLERIKEYYIRGDRQLIDDMIADYKGILRRKGY